MILNLELISNNVTYQEGDTLLITFDKPFRYVSSINGISFDFTPLDNPYTWHDVEIRWSYDVAQLDRATGKPHIVFSAWESYSTGGVINSNIASLYSRILEKDAFDLQFRLTRKGTESGARTVSRLAIDFTTHNPPETAPISPFGKETCNAKSCSTTNFGSGVTLKCDENSLFRPYDVMAPGIQLYSDLACAVSEMFGHCVRYFKTEAKLESADVILKEYSLFEVKDVKDIRIMVPDNAFPDNALKFLPFDMDFEEGMEVHIVREHFERAFGQDNLPEQKDYLYFPLIDRIFEVHSAYLYRDFMMGQYYYKVMLYKWQDKDNVMRNDPAIDNYVNALHENLDEILGVETQREYDEVTKPLQYNTTSVGGFDKVRSVINTTLKIETRDLTNYFTVVGKYFYDMTSLSQNELAVVYKQAVNRSSTENTAFSMWFKTLKTNFGRLQTNTRDIIFEGYNDAESKGYRLAVNYVAGTTPNSAVIGDITATINAQQIVYDNLPTIQADKWYAIVFNHMNEFSQATLHIWEMKYNPNQPSQNKTTDLKLIYVKTAPITPQQVNPTNTAYKLYGGTYGVTNLRIWKESIEEEKQPIVLNQYVVKDNDLALIIDNAIPPLRMVKEYVR